MKTDAPRPDGPELTSGRVAAALLAVAFAAALLGLMLALSAHGLYRRPYGNWMAPALPLMCALFGVMVVASAILRPGQRRWGQLLISSAAAILVLGWAQGLALHAFAALVSLASRMRCKLRYRIALAVVGWAVWPMLSWHGLIPSELGWRGLAVVWAGLPFAALYTLVERERGTLSRLSVADDLFYLIALPRLLAPFVQPISIARFYASEAPVDLRRGLRALGLGLFGCALGIVLAKWGWVTPAAARAALEQGDIVLARLGPPRNAIYVYAANASAIFCAVALFRMLGFHIHSGFRQPFLSQSFADFFRRWNSYIYEAVLSLFFFPLMGLLRTRLPPVLATVVAAYLAIFFGAYGLTYVLAPLAATPNIAKVAHHMWQPGLLGVMALYWTAIIVPQLLVGRRRSATRSARVLRIFRFLSVLTLLGTAAWAMNLVII